MIVVRVEMHSAVTKKVQDLGTMVINNTGTGTESLGNYRVRMYRKSKRSVLTRLTDGTKPFRQGYVNGHLRLSKPVHSLVLKALKELGYE